MGAGPFTQDLIFEEGASAGLGWDRLGYVGLGWDLLGYVGLGRIGMGRIG